MQTRILLIVMLLSFFLLLPTVHAEEHATETNPKEEHKKPKKDDEALKARSDSVISVIMALPEVKKWKQWIESKHDDSEMDIWGEGVKEVEGSKCWGVAVAERKGDDVKVMARFHIMQTGLEIWVEQVSHEIPETTTYYSYENWRKKCRPTENSAGSCTEEVEKK